MVSGCAGTTRRVATVSGAAEHRSAVERHGTTLALATSPRVDRSQVRLTLREVGEQGKLDRFIAQLTQKAEATGFTDLGVLVELSARLIERGSLRARAER